MNKDTNLDQSAQQSKEAEEAKLPELKFTEVVKSSERVVETADDSGEKVAIFHQQGDYTFVVDKGNKVIFINQDGRTESMPTNNFYRTFNYKWKEIQGWLQKKWNLITKEA